MGQLGAAWGGDSVAAGQLDANVQMMAFGEGIGGLYQIVANGYGTALWPSTFTTYSDADGRLMQDSFTGLDEQDGDICTYDGDRLLLQSGNTFEGEGENDNINYYMWGPTGLALSFGNNAVVGYTYDPNGTCLDVALAYVTSSGFRQDTYKDRSEFYPFYTAPYTVAHFATNFMDAFGEPMYGFDHGGQTFEWDQVQYKGQYGYYSFGTNGTMSLCYCHHRWYDPQIGRWISRDPTGLDGGVNVYEFCNDNPVMFCDPSGLDALIVHGWDEGVEGSQVGYLYTKHLLDPWGPTWTNTELNKPTKWELIKEMVNTDADTFYFWGHGGSDHGSLELQNGLWFKEAGIRLVARLRAARGKPKFKQAILRSCDSVSFNRTIDAWLGLTESVQGFVGSSLAHGPRKMTVFTRTPAANPRRTSDPQKGDRKTD